MRKVFKKICIISFLLVVLFLYVNTTHFTISEKNIPETTIGIEEVVVVPYQEIDSIINNAKKLIDEGKTLYISSPECSNEELATLFSIPKDDITIYNPLVLLATSIYKLKDIYVFENHYAAFESQQEITSTNKNSFYNNVITVKEKNSSGKLHFTLQPEENTDIAIKSQQSTINFVNQLNNSTIRTNNFFPNHIYAASIELYTLDGKTLGYVKTTQNNIDIGYTIVNNQKQYVYDLLTKFEFSLNNNYIIDYKGRMHCNISGHTALENNSIISGISYSNFMNQNYDFKSQKIIDSSPMPNVYDWMVKPKHITLNESYDFISELRVATTNSSGSRGGFSSMFINHYMFGIPIRNCSFEIGGWF